MEVNRYSEDVASTTNGLFGVDVSIETANVVVYPIPWDLTCSYGLGAADNTTAILEASTQLDLWDIKDPSAWKKGIVLTPPNATLSPLNSRLRPSASDIYQQLEKGLELSETQRTAQNDINQACQTMLDVSQDDISAYLQQGKSVIVLGGDHSVSLAYVRALSKQHDSFGILQLDAHMDFRDSYAGFHYSHAAVIRRISELPQVSDIVQVGIRDCAASEVAYSQDCQTTVHTYYDEALQCRQFEGETWANLCQEIVSKCPEKVYITTDIDGLDVRYCPSTGTPVPGGLSYAQWLYLVQELKRQNKQIIGIDLVEVVAGTEWDANVGARLLYQYAMLI